MKKAYLIIWQKKFNNQTIIAVAKSTNLRDFKKSISQNVEPVHIQPEL
jgi:hypothetical protein